MSALPLAIASYYHASILSASLRGKSIMVAGGTDNISSFVGIALLFLLRLLVFNM